MKVEREPGGKKHWKHRRLTSDQPRASPARSPVEYTSPTEHQRRFRDDSSESRPGLASGSRFRCVPREEPGLEAFTELRSDGLCNINWRQWGQLPVRSMGRIVVRHHEIGYGTIDLDDIMACLLGYEIGAKKDQSLVVDVYQVGQLRRRVGQWRRSKEELPCIVAGCPTKATATRPRHHCHRMPT